MLADKDFNALRELDLRGAPVAERSALIARIRAGLNPHPAGQTIANVPRLQGRAVKGVQHEYAETLLVFPSAGQTCHANCTYCFQWAQFTSDQELRFATREVTTVAPYTLRSSTSPVPSSPIL